MKLKIEEIIEALESMTMLELNDLVKAIEEKFNVSAAAPVAAASSEGAATSEPTEVNLVLKAIGGNKVSVIKAVKEISGLGLMEAKKLTESAPVNIKEAIKPEEAKELGEKLIAAGAEIEIK